MCEVTNYRFGGQSMENHRLSSSDSKHSHSNQLIDMNPDFVQLLGNTLPPRNGKSHTHANTVAVSKNGDIALLSESGSIQYSNLRSTGHPTELIRLEVLGITASELMTMTTVEFDADGKSLLLWSESKVGIVELPQSLTAGSNLRRDEIDTSCVFTSLWDANDEGVSNLVAKATFHQSCSHCVVILMRKDVLRLIDLRSLQSEIIPLSTNRRFVSFSFGPAIEWMAHTLVLLTSGGEVYYLCPVIPNGTVLSLAAVEELWAWMDHIHHERRDHYIYQDTYNAYLFNLFGPRPVISDEASARSTFVRAGESATGSPAFSEEGLLGLGSSEPNTMCNYTPALRGPIAIRRDTATNELAEGAAPALGRRIFSDEGKRAHGEKESPMRDSEESSARVATDIASLGSQAGPAFDLTPSAPIISIAYNTGEVEVFMLDYPQIRPPGVSVHSNSSFVGPSWRPVDQTRAGLNCTSGSLLLAEVVALRPAESSAVGDAWRLKADPVLSHVLHATCVRLCESHLLSVVWLEKALEVQFEQRHGDNSSDAGTPSEADAVSSSPLTHPTRVLPVFVLPPGAAAASAGGNGHGHQESKSATSSSVTTATGELSGAVIVHDAMLGHVALFRTSTGLASAVNLTVHTKICELQDTLQMHAGASELLPLKEELDRATNSEQIRWKRSQLCIKKVAEGLRDMPQLDATTASALTSQPSSQNKKILLETAQKLERDVLVPLNELAQTTLFSYELLQETYRSQVQVLEGSDDASSSSSHSEPNSLAQGLKKLLVSLNSEHDVMDERVRKIQEKFAAQREKAEKYLAFAVSQRDKLTKAEGLYKKQLESWSRVVSQMNEQVSTLRSLTGSLPSAEGVSTCGGGGSPRAQPPLFSITQQGAPGSAVKNSPVPNRAFRSPAPVSSETPRGASSAASPGFARYGHLGAAEPSVSTPLAGGRFGVADTRPYSTPSSARGVETGSANVTPASAMFNRQYHTRHPPQASPTPNFYSQYRSARGAGSSTAGEATPGTTGTGTGASATGATARSTRTTTAQFASPGFRSPQTVGREARSVDPPVQLSQQDQDACTELLISQTDLLEKAQQELEQLEDKLKSLRREHITS